MPFIIVRNDITAMEVDAIVNPSDRHLSGTGGVDRAVHQAAGPGLAEECRALGGCAVGEAKRTRSYGLPCRWVIHTAGPRWMGGWHREREKLAACYRSGLALARETGCETVAFPLIAAGTFGFPRVLALQTAEEVIQDFLEDCDMTVYLVVFDRSSYRISARRQADIAAYIDDRYVEQHQGLRSQMLLRRGCEEEGETPWRKLSTPLASFPAPAPLANASLDEALCHLDESFGEMLLRKIDERGMTDAQCYKRANIDRKLFSKIRGNPGYKPSKPTALAFAVALELPLEETRELLMKAGFALSRSSKFDVIVEYFISRGCYSIFEINEALFAFDQRLLGG